ncbi:MAG: ATP-binding protein [Bacteroidota bacterium]
MQEAPISTRGSFWLISAAFLFVISAVTYLYDADRTDAEIIERIGTEIQEDLHSCIEYLTQNPDLEPGPTDLCQHTKLVYNSDGLLKSWSDETYLPAQTYIDRLRDISTLPLIQLQDRYYYQIRKDYLDSTNVFLIPLYTSYPVQNQFLVPYVFLGRHRKATSSDRDLDNFREWQITPGESEQEAQIQLLDQEGRTILSIDGMQAMAYRTNLRFFVLIGFFLALISFSFYLRVLVIRNKDARFWINWSVFGGVILIRGLLYLLSFPGQYLDVQLFSPDILAFHPLAPSLGEMSLNIMTLLVLVFILYMQFRRRSHAFLRKLNQDTYVAYPAMLLTTAVSSFILYWYVKVFQSIIKNSLVEIEFSNIFQTNIFSYLILLDVGMLLLACMFAIIILLKLNTLFASRYHFPVRWIFFQVVSLLALNLYLNMGEWDKGLMNALFIGIILVAQCRYPYKSFFQQDVTNYLIYVFVFSILVTYNVIQGVNENNNRKAARIAQSVLGSQAANTVFAYDKATTRIEDELPIIQGQYRNQYNASDFRDWVVSRYLSPNFKEFDVSLFLYNEEKERLDTSSTEAPLFGLNFEEMVVNKGGERASSKFDLYRLPDAANKYLDIYVGRHDLILDPDSGGVTWFLMQLKPSSNEARGLYPSLALDQRVYDDLKRINALDYAVYRDGVLFVKNGEASFPTILKYSGKEKDLRSSKDGDSFEYIEQIDIGKVVVIRYTKKSFYDWVTTFSLIFYYFLLAAFIFVGLPYLITRRLRRGYKANPIPLRAKIRNGLLIISVLPMIVIIALLYPFVSAHYYENTEQELIEEANRLTEVMENDYLQLKQNPFGFGLQSQKIKFQKVIDRLEKLLLNDISVFDSDGRRIATTQPQIAENGIYTDLMPVVALKQLSRGQQSELVLKESIGRLEYLSAYQPIVGGNGKPAGYINIPYLTKQDQLESQVIEFLAYLANTYLLVFLLLNVIAVLVSNTITKPLAVVQQRLGDTGLGEKNEPIDYQSNDEIGDIVQAYNQMVGKLEQSEEQIAANERELAWRQMARQVAHEIKNPLTPMRLSIQHLLRSYKDKPEKFEKMFPKVMSTLMVQIDSLVNIANSFSEFAKMPEPIKQHVRVNDILTEVVDLYSQADDAIWLIDIPSDPFISYADRDQLSRCFNNIIKNGLQAIDDNGIMHVSMRVLSDRARIEIKDNGKGMTEEVQKRIFEPSFSTKTSGMGLGLAIVKKIIENIGGKIAFRSELNVGTTFVIEIPSTAAQDEAESLQLQKIS